MKVMDLYVRRFTSTPLHINFTFGLILTGSAPEPSALTSEAPLFSFVNLSKLLPNPPPPHPANLSQTLNPNRSRVSVSLTIKIQFANVSETCSSNTAQARSSKTITLFSSLSLPMSEMPSSLHPPPRHSRSLTIWSTLIAAVVSSHSLSHPISIKSPESNSPRSPSKPQTIMRH